MKPGHKTTEFWLTIITQALGILALFGVINPQQQGALTQGLSQIIGAIMMILSSFGYSISRGLAKQKTKEDTENVERR